jgi:hypothetical protein
MAMLMTLTNRSTFAFIPVVHALHFIKDVKKIKEGERDVLHVPRL